MAEQAGLELLLKSNTLSTTGLIKSYIWQAAFTGYEVIDIFPNFPGHKILIGILTFGFEYLKFSEAFDIVCFHQQ